LAGKSIPREKIKWFPTIDYDKCTGCLSCVNFCHFNVYSIEGSSPPKPKVANPYNCMVGCEGCAKVCPVNAISFPSREELKHMLKEAKT
jgi:NAD-dependent dihydropyrimidine dehydrogenase PreA subunit